MERPYLNLRVEEIQTLYRGRNEDSEFLQQLVLELAHRRTPSARRLLAEVSTHLQTLEDVLPSQQDEPLDDLPLEAHELGNELSQEERLDDLPLGAQELSDDPSPGSSVLSDLVELHWGDVSALDALRVQLRDDTSQDRHALLRLIEDRMSELRRSNTFSASSPDNSNGLSTSPVPPTYELMDLIAQHWENPDELKGLARLLEHHSGNEQRVLFWKVLDQLAELEVAVDFDSFQEPIERVEEGVLPFEEWGASEDDEPDLSGRVEGVAGTLPSRWSTLTLHVNGERFDSSEWDMAESSLGFLEAAETAEEHELHLAASEWDLDPAILIHDASDIHARKHWAELLEPFEHQVKNLITFCRRAPVALIADDVGLGKTISAGLILSELMVRGKVHRTLIVAPKILLPQWKEELLSKFRLRAEYATGQELDLLIGGGTEIVITTYASLRNRMDRVEEAGFDMVVMDEAHKLRNLYGTNKPPLIAERMRGALEARAFRYVLMLTATPIQNRLWDLYSLLDLLTVAKGHENPLGTPDAFALRFIADGKSTARRLHPGRREEFRQILSQYMVRTRRADADLEFPERTVLLERARGSSGEAQLMSLVGEIITDLNALAQSSVAQALMSSPEALVKQLGNMAERGTVRPDVVESARSIAHTIHETGKQTLLLKLLGKLRDERPEDWRVVVFTTRRETQDAIGRVLTREFGVESIGFVRGGQHEANRRSVQGYGEDPPQVHVVVSTEAGSEGLNLQAGNVIVNYDLPWNPMVLEQRIGRIQRLGSRHARVLVMNLVLSGSVEERVVGRLAAKLSTISETLGDVEGILETLSGDADDEGTMETRLRELVVQSLAGMDVAASVRRMQQSIDRAKSIYEEEKQTVEEHLGRLDAMHDQGPRMPALTGTEPRMSSREFVIHALGAQGGTLKPLDGGRWQYTRSGYAPEEVVFTREDLNRHRRRGFAGGPRVSLYLPGQPAFEKLGEHWRRRSHHRIKNLMEGDSGVADDLARDWVRGLGETVELVDVVHQASETAFQGTIVVRAAVSIAHDKYEKLVELNVTPREHVLPDEAMEAEEGRVPEGLDLAEVRMGESTLEPIYREALSHDADVGKFATFYLKRLDEERRKTGGDARLLELHKQSFTPRVSASTVGVSGAVFSVLRSTIHYQVDGQGPYTSQIELLPAARRVLRSPELVICERTRKSLPSDCMGRCAITDAVVLKHELQESDLSGRAALPERTATCEVSARALLEDEVGVSSVSGKHVGRDLLLPSAASGELALRDELCECSFTGTLMLPSESAVSEVSGGTMRLDESIRGGHSSQLGHRSEFRECSGSGAWLLPSEGVVSDMSGSFVDSRLAVTSAKSGRVVALSESVVCDESGSTLAEDEIAESSVSGKSVDKDLLVASREGGALALPAEMESCAVTGLLVLPSELRTCSVTGRRVLEREAEEDSMHAGVFMISGEAGRSETSGRASNPQNLVRCEWDGQIRLRDEVGECVVTGATVGAEYLRSDERLDPLMKLIERPAGGRRNVSFSQPVSGSSAIGDFTRLREVRALVAPSASVVAVTAIQKRFLGLSSRRIGFLLSTEGELKGGLVVPDR
jgi:superfamily II DNA or RNA helicase